MQGLVYQRLQKRVWLRTTWQYREFATIDEEPAVFSFSTKPTAVERINDWAVDWAAWQAGGSQDLDHRRVDRVARMEDLR